MTLPAGLWVETEQGDFHQFAYPTRAAAESARALFADATRAAPSQARRSTPIRRRPKFRATPSPTSAT
ncbi:MAG: hypothetical protein M9883_04285 [Methylobacteriaceae bacterium]|nr:hypothetical protein [Methylobacteriaceae bacterium]